MVVEFAEFGGNGLYLGSNELYKIFVGEPELFKEMVVEFARLGGKRLYIMWNELNTILDSTIETD
jgi:hypothetical protein